MHKIITLALFSAATLSQSAEASILEYFNITSTTKKNQQNIRPAAPLNEVEKPISHPEVTEESLYGNEPAKVIDLRDDPAPQTAQKPAAHNDNNQALFGAPLTKGSPMEAFPVDFASGFFVGEGAMNYYVEASYRLNSLSNISLRPYYSNYGNSQHDVFEHMGGDLSLTAQLPNRSLFTPEAGVGVGYETWIRSHDDQVFHDASSPTLSYFYGATVKLTNFFELVLRKTTRNYLSDSAKKSPHLGDKDSEIGTQFQAGFQVVL